jgi:hypothetical protein
MSDRGLDALFDAVVVVNGDAFYGELYERLVAADRAGGASRAVEARALRRVRVAMLLDAYDETEIAARIGISVRSVKSDVASLRSLFSEHRHGELRRAA